jgi:DNA-binding NarL/FixJ family response regulator
MTHSAVLTTYADDETIIAALKAGARGYLTRNADRRAISQTLHSAAAGHAILRPEVTAMLLAGAAPTQPVKGLRRRAASARGIDAILQPTA